MRHIISGGRGVKRRYFRRLSTSKQLGRWSQVPSWMPRNRENWRIFCHILGPRTANPRLGARAGSGALPQGTFVIWRTKKGKIIVVFLRLTSFRRVWFRPESGTFLQILGVPTGEKTRRNEENTPKRRLSEVGHESFFLRKFRFSCPFGVKKAAIPRPGSLH